MPFKKVTVKVSGSQEFTFEELKEGLAERSEEDPTKLTIDQVHEIVSEMLADGDIDIELTDEEVTVE